jgi:hypothetical protein
MDLALLARGPFHEPRMTVRAREKIDHSQRASWLRARSHEAMARKRADTTVPEFI